jgi:hypothetical protein
MKTFYLKDYFSLDKFYHTQSYMANPDYYSKFGLLGHEGWDCSHTNKTKEIKAVHNGECLTAYSSSYGRYVIVLDYKQLCATWYCHLSRASIVNGQRVKAGDVIGNMGSTGNSTGPHLHLNFVQIDKNGVRLYKRQDQNQGFLDPQHPLDSKSTINLPGIEPYKIVWFKENIMDEYKGLDLSNRESMKKAVDVWYEVSVENKYIKKEECESKQTQLKKDLDAVKKELSTCQNKAKEDLAKKEAECQRKLDDQKTSLLKQQEIEAEKYEEEINSLLNTIEDLKKAKPGVVVEKKEEHTHPDWMYKIGWVEKGS